MNGIGGEVQRLLSRELAAFAREVEEFADDATLWQTLPGVTNSAGNLALHVAGNLKHYVGAVLGGSRYVRRREAEFATREGTRASVARELNEAAEVVSRVLPAIPASVLSAPFPESVGGVTPRCDRFLLHLSTHLAFHLGQASYLRRVLTQDARGTGAVSVRALVEG
jgi:uncharacterized damage-inducible protein DinB